jgi:diadenosine tetraphosphate (Ap4A) HIT family hydrolase/5-methylcytosine-specific restriction endonuclease McrA
MSIYSDLLDFIQNRMRMAHIYQPVMLTTLIKGGGTASVTEIASQFAQRDQALIEYYSKITKEMPGRVLGQNHGIVTAIRGERNDIIAYHLNGYSYLTPEQREELLHACQEKYERYLDARGQQVYQHRRMARGYISGTLIYEVMKRARYRCELCGVSAAEVALEVDHIQPRSLGGGDELNNLQALCYRCNARKGNKDNTDFRENHSLHEVRESGCLFCTIPADRSIILQAELAYVIPDKFPVTAGHSLIIPKRHEPSWFELSQGELAQCNLLIKQMKEKIRDEEKEVLGFNVGINDGSVAGQTIMHSHIHLIPRRKDDLVNPRGGVRGVVPGMQSY